jgi:hypothetical protein
VHESPEFNELLQPLIVALIPLIGVLLMVIGEPLVLVIVTVLIGDWAVQSALWVSEVIVEPPLVKVSEFCRIAVAVML